MKVNKLKKISRKMKISSIARNVAVLMFIFSTAVMIYIFFCSHPVSTVFPVRHIAFAGNKHLTDNELKALSGIRLNECLITISNTKISLKMLKSPWIRSVNVRKEFPDNLAITIKEAEPFALLNMNEHLFLVDENGKLLEELKDDAIPFLPVITGDPYKEKKGFTEALNLIKLLNAKGFSSEKDHIEIIAHKPHELSLDMDGTIVKIGNGGYEEKIERLVRLEEDIKHMNIPIDSIDLRFENKAIVKPVINKVTK
jgi:cell division protein FtsQ